MAINTGEFEKIVITDAGRAMISGTSNNNTITFTRIALGDGQIQSPDDIFTLTKIKHECLSMPIVSKKDITDGQIRLEFRLNNSEIETGFTFREIGIMAHMADGIEQLYAYTYAKDPTQIYNKNTPIQERIIYADIVVGNSENINIILDLSNTYARMQDIADHNTDPTAHKTGIAGNAATSTKALQDTKGQQIDTTYIKSITASNATITTTKGNGATSNITINNVAHATNADNATKATNDSDGKAINATYIKKASGTGENLTLANDNFGRQLTIKRNSGNAATIKYTNTNNVNRYIGFTGSDKTMYRWGDNGDGQTAFLDASNYNNYAPTKTGGGASGTWNININGNAKTSTKATQDSAGQAINSTYVKGVTANNATLTITKGNGSTSTITVNNVANATKATQDANGTTISTGFLNRNRGGIPSGNFDSAYTEGLYTWHNTETNRPCDWGRLLTLNTNYNTTGSWIWQLAFPTRNDNLKLRTRTNGEDWLGWRTIPFTDSPAFSGSPTAPTPGTSDNSTRIPNTSWVQTWVKNFINNLSGNLQVKWSGASFTIPALGVSGLAQQTGYINFGKLFGGFKIQWGNNSSSSRSVNIKYPIAFTSFVVPLTTTNDNGMDYVYRFSVGGFNTTSFNQILVGSIGGSSINRLWIAVGV